MYATQPAPALTTASGLRRTPMADRVLLSEELLSEAALVAYVAASGASWCFLNTCQSIALGQRIIDRDAGRCDLHDYGRAGWGGDAHRGAIRPATRSARRSREAYERSKPGDNRHYRLSGQLQAAADGSSRIGRSVIRRRTQQDRLQTTMDEMRRDMSGMAADVAVLKTRTGTIDVQQQEIEIG